MPLFVEADTKTSSEVHSPTSTESMAGYVALALQIQEAASDMTASDVGRKLGKAVQDAHKGTGKYASYLDHSGDHQSGDVIYSCNGDTMSCPYEMQGGEDGTAATASLDTDNAKKVQPRVTYEDEPDADEAAHYTQMSEAWVRDKIYKSCGLQLYERFVPKGERDKMDE